MKRYENPNIVVLLFDENDRILTESADAEKSWEDIFGSSSAGSGSSGGGDVG